MRSKRLDQVQGLLVIVDHDIQYWNKVFGQDFDGYIAQTCGGFTDMYGFYGIPLKEGLCYFIGTV